MDKTVDPETVARLLLRHAINEDESPAISLAVAASIHEQLRTSLSIFFGKTGFDALWRRAISGVTPPMPGVGSARTDGDGVVTSYWLTSLSERNPDERYLMIVASFTNFISLLFTLVGPEIGVRLLQQVWQDLPTDAPGPTTGDAS